jgi:AcrR family transcriptional regulator
VSRRAATKEANRAAILAAARAVFAEEGYDAVGVRDIVRRTGLAPGTFYNYFDGKDAVFRVLVSEVGAEARRHVRDARLNAPPGRFVADGFRAFFAFIASDPDTFAFLSRNLATIRERFADAGLPEGLAELREDLATRVVDGVDVEYCAHAMVAVGLELGVLLLGREPADVDGATAFAVRMFAGTLR